MGERRLLKSRQAWIQPVIFRNHDNFGRSFRFRNPNYFVIKNSLRFPHVCFHYILIQNVFPHELWISHFWGWRRQKSKIVSIFIKHEITHFSFTTHASKRVSHPLTDQLHRAIGDFVCKQKYENYENLWEFFSSGWNWKFFWRVNYLITGCRMAAAGSLGNLLGWGFEECKYTSGNFTPGRKKYQNKNVKITKKNM